MENQENRIISNAVGSDMVEIYKLYVEMADRISERRIKTNNLFISINTLIITAITLLDDMNQLGFVLISSTGIILAIAWFFLIKSYKQLNSGKFKVVHEIEASLPIAPYHLEWTKLGEGKDKKLYWPVSHLETILPLLVGLLYISLLIYSFFMCE